MERVFIRLPTKSGMTWRHFIVRSHTRIETHVWPLKKKALFRQHSPFEVPKDKLIPAKQVLPEGRGKIPWNQANVGFLPTRQGLL